MANTMSEELRNTANKILAHSKAKLKDENFGFDPITIIMITGLIINLIRLWYSCSSREGVYGAMKNPSFLYKLALKREIRKKFKNSKERAAIYDSMIDVSKNLSEREMNDILNEVEEIK